MAIYTVEENMSLYGQAVMDWLSEAYPESAETTIDVAIGKAYVRYSFETPIDGEDDLTDSQREMVALDALYNLLTNLKQSRAASGGDVQKVRIGSDNTPEITFFERAKVFAEVEMDLKNKLTQAHVDNGFVPFLSPDSHAVFVGTRLDMMTDAVGTEPPAETLNEDVETALEENNDGIL